MKRLFFPRANVFSPLLILAVGCTISGCGQDRDSAPAKTSEQSQDTEQSKDSENKAAVPTVPVVPIQLKQLDRTFALPGELEAYQNVPIHAKVEGFISYIGVDRGSVLKKGAKMITISCPELDQKLKEAEAKVSAAEASYERSVSGLASERSKKVEVKSKLDSDQLTLDRLRVAAKTPGAIALNEVDVQAKAVESDSARVESIGSEVSAAQAVVLSEKNNVLAAKNVVKSLQAMTTYLDIRAPFDGVITERNVHEGSIVAVDASRRDEPLVRIQQKDILRLVVAVPEDCVAGLKDGQVLTFTVPAFLGKRFQGTVARLGYALDTKTRTMPVELNVDNRNGELEPGMFASVTWKVSRPYPTLFVPSPAVSTDLKGTFVIVTKDGVSKRVDVTRGQSMGDLVEIVGNVKAGDLVALKATNELKTGTKLIAKAATENDMNKAMMKSSAGGE
ncbi:MAG: efflux RND transporter periplasmic adaptor subunit [Candidatus Obscuribacterales bacterium]|nr:efflux RND transporter periplasmic adaptor subunit [Candidatus Obscuribacterales bacterium]